MSVFAPDDTSTPESLLNDAVRFAKEILADLKTATAFNKREWNPGVYSLGIVCTDDISDNPINRMRRDIGNTLILRGDYAAEHPAIVDAFMETIVSIMTGQGFAYADGVNTNKRVKDYTAGDFDFGMTCGLLTISSFGIAAHTAPEKLLKALDVSDDALRAISLESLQKRFAEMAELAELSNKTSTKNASTAANNGSKGNTGPAATTPG